MPGDYQHKSPAPGASARSSATVVSLKHYRLARAIAEAGRQQEKLAQILRDSADDRKLLAHSLRSAQHQLAGVAENYRQLLGRLAREQSFRNDCRDAAELDDLDEMIRRRDELASRLAALRSEPVRRLVSDQV